MYCIAARIGPDNSQTSYCCLAQSVNVQVAPVRGEEGGLYINLHILQSSPAVWIYGPQIHPKGAQ